MMKQTRRRQDVQGIAQAAIIDLAHGYRRLPSLNLRPLREGQWAKHSLSGCIGKLDHDGATIRLAIEEGDTLPFSTLFQMMELRNEPVALTLEDDTKLYAEIGDMRGLGEVADIRLYHWNWTTQHVPRLWVGLLRGSFPRFGNLSAIEQGDNWVQSKHGGYRLSGTHTWNLLPTANETEALIVVEPGDDVISRDSLLNDFYALQFVMGGGLQLDYLIGIDGSWKAVGALSVASFERPRSQYRPPTAHRRGEAEIWLPELFRLVARKLARDAPIALKVAINSYLDSKSDHLDGAYLKAQVGLEASAKRMISEGSPDLLVKDEVAWKAWISELEPTIVAHLRSPDSLDVVVGKFIGAKHAPSGSVVRKALEHHGIVVPDYILKEIKNRSLPAHGFLMNRDRELERDLDRDVRRLEIIQTLIAALAALYVGYGGPLHGYDVADDGGRQAPQWWRTTTAKASVEVWHVAKRHVSGPRPIRTNNDASTAEPLDSPIEDAIRERAYFLWRDRLGVAWWDPISNWLEAEASL